MQFTNAWGMSDEDLYTQALKVADADHAAGKPFFLQLMTVLLLLVLMVLLSLLVLQLLSQL